MLELYLYCESYVECNVTKTETETSFINIYINVCLQIFEIISYGLLYSIAVVRLGK